MEDEKEQSECCGASHLSVETIENYNESGENLESLEKLSDFFKVLGDLTRVRILTLLSVEEMCVCDMARALGMTSPAVSHQLRVLKGSHFITSTRRGKSVYYRLKDQHIYNILRQGLEHTEE